MIYIGSDHAGFSLKETLMLFLQQQEVRFTDCGPKTLDPHDDYPLFAKVVCEKIKDDDEGVGLLMCDTGIGMDITANKFPFIRAALCKNVFMAGRAREHNNANVLVLSAIDADIPLYHDIIYTFINTPFSEEERHKRRIQEIAQI